MSEDEAIRAALEELGWKATAEELRQWCTRKGVTPSASFEKKVLAVLLLESSHALLTEQAAGVNAELEERIRLRRRQLDDLRNSGGEN